MVCTRAYRTGAEPREAGHQSTCSVRQGVCLLPRLSQHLLTQWSHGFLSRSLWAVMLSRSLTVLGNQQMVRYCFPVHCEHFRCFLRPGGHNTGVIVRCNHCDSCTGGKPALSILRCYLSGHGSEPWRFHSLSHYEPANRDVRLRLWLPWKGDSGGTVLVSRDCCLVGAPLSGSSFPLGSLKQSDPSVTPQTRAHHHLVSQVTYPEVSALNFLTIAHVTPFSGRLLYPFLHSFCVLSRISVALSFFLNF